MPKQSSTAFLFSAELERVPDDVSAKDARVHAGVHYHSPCAQWAWREDPSDASRLCLSVRRGTVTEKAVYRMLAEVSCDRMNLIR